MPTRTARPNGATSPVPLMVRQTLAIARRILTEYVRQRRSLIFWAVFPALMLLLFGLMYRNNASLRAGFDTTAAGILIGAALFFSCLGGTVSLIVAERERRTLRIAMARVHSPAILVLDEPTSAVDLEARHELWQLIDTLKRTGTTILLTTHHLDEAEHLCSRIGIMKNGRIAKAGTVAELLAAVPAEAIALVETAKEEAVLRRAGELGWGIRHYAGKIGCLLPQQVSLRAAVDALQDIDVSSVSLQRVSLEHAHLEVVQSET